jgi:hypothetical protein
VLRAAVNVVETMLVKYMLSEWLSAPIEVKPPAIFVTMESVSLDI